MCSCCIFLRVSQDHCGIELGAMHCMLLSFDASSFFNLLCQRTHHMIWKWRSTEKSSLQSPWNRFDWKSKEDIATKLRKDIKTSSRQRKLFASRKWLWKINKLNDRTINNYSAPGFIAKHCDLSVSVTDKLFIYLLKGFMSCSRNVINNEKYWSRVKISWKNKYLDVITTSSLDLPTSQAVN